MTAPLEHGVCVQSGISQVMVSPRAAHLRAVGSCRNDGAGSRHEELRTLMRVGICMQGKYQRRRQQGRPWKYDW